MMMILLLMTVVIMMTVMMMVMVMVVMMMNNKLSFWLKMYTCTNIDIFLLVLDHTLLLLTLVGREGCWLSCFLSLCMLVVAVVLMLWCVGREGKERIYRRNITSCL